MAAQSTSTLRSHAKGLARRHLSVGLFAGVAALPLLTMGITVPSAVAKSRAVSQRDEMRSRLAEREELHMALREYQTGTTLESLKELHRGLEAMIPAGVGHLTEFGELRSAAETLGIKIQTIQHVRAHAVNAEVSGGVVVDEVLVVLREPVNQVFGLVNEIRKHGLPVLVLSFDLARETPQERAFQSEVRLGFVRRIAPSPSGESSAR